MIGEMTAVCPDRRKGRAYTGNWTAIWKVETTTGTQYLHTTVPGTSGYHDTPEDRAVVQFAALEYPPAEILAARKAAGQ